MAQIVLDVDDDLKQRVEAKAACEGRRELYEDR